MTNTETDKFGFYLSEKQQFLVVTFSGALIKATLPEFQKCEKQILESQAKYIVLNFQELQQMDLTAIRPLAQLQKQIREKPAQLKICAIQKKFCDLLTEAAAVRPQELCQDLAQALKSFDILPSPR
jgi:anti-anti-sigma factor